MKRTIEDERKQRVKDLKEAIRRGLKAHENDQPEAVKREVHIAILCFEMVSDYLPKEKLKKFKKKIRKLEGGCPRVK